MNTHPDWMTFEDDIPMQAAQDAHRGTSFSPEKRGEQERQSYGNTMRGDWSALYELANTDEKRAALVGDFARYRAGYKARTLACLSAQSRIVSTMIAGPANFNVRRAEKANSSADNRTRELIEFRERALKAIRRTLCPEDAPIMTGDADAVERLAAKIVEAETLRETMKAENEAARKAGILHPHQPYRLTNLGANIRRMKQRAEHVARVQAAPAKTEQGAAARFEDAPQDNRIRLFFPGKPADDVRAELKRRGFRWTPSLGCWQAYRNAYAMDTARRLAGLPDESAPTDHVCPDGPSCPDPKCRAERGL